MQVVPAAIERRAEKYRLGRLQGVYAFRKQVPLGYILGPVSMLIGCLILALLVLLYGNMWQQLTNLISMLGLLPVTNWQNWQLLLIAFVGIAWLLVGVWMIVAAHLVRGMRVFVYEYGLISLRIQATVVLWQDVVSLWKDIRVVGRQDKARSERNEGNGGKGEKKGRHGKGRRQHVRRVYTVQCADERLVRFDDELVDIEKLGTLLEDTITRRLLPGVIATYEAGSVVAFADVAVSSRGVAIRRARQLLPWHGEVPQTVGMLLCKRFKQILCADAVALLTARTSWQADQTRCGMRVDWRCGFPAARFHDALFNARIAVAIAGPVSSHAKRASSAPSTDLAHVQKVRASPLLRARNACTSLIKWMQRRSVSY